MTVLLGVLITTAWSLMAWYYASKPETRDASPFCAIMAAVSAILTLCAWGWGG